MPDIIHKFCFSRDFVIHITNGEVELYLNLSDCGYKRLLALLIKSSFRPIRTSPIPLSAEFIKNLFNGGNNDISKTRGRFPRKSILLFLLLLSERMETLFFGSAAVGLLAECV